MKQESSRMHRRSALRWLLAGTGITLYGCGGGEETSPDSSAVTSKTLSAPETLDRFRFKIVDLSRLLPGVMQSRAVGINNKGHVTGGTDNAGPFVYENGVPHVYGGFNSGAGWDINDNGQATGILRFIGGDQAFLYRDGVFHTIGTLGGGFSQGLGINSAGAVVGFSTVADAPEPSFMRTE